MGCPKFSAMLVAVVLVVAATGAEGQTTLPPCEQELVPCGAYYNSTNPPASCCTPLLDAITNELSCICQLYILYANSPALLATLGFNYTQALSLPQRCNITFDFNSSCVQAPAPSPTCSTGSTPATNGVGRITWTGMSTILLFWTCTMIY